MLHTAQFKTLIDDRRYIDDLALCVVDEAHLVIPWETSFRPWPEYSQLCALRARLPTSVTFLAMTATLQDSEGRAKTQQALGLRTNGFNFTMRDSRLIALKSFIESSSSIRHPLVSSSPIAFLIPKIGEGGHKTYHEC